jgi:ankyrin repeat protein
MTALGLAAAAGYLDIARLLLEHGADLQSAGRGLDLALQRGYLEIVHVLTEHGAKGSA